MFNRDEHVSSASSNHNYSLLITKLKKYYEQESKCKA